MVSMLQDINPLRNLTALERLRKTCASLRELPEWIGDFTLLQTLNVKFFAMHLSGPLQARLSSKWRRLFTGKNISEN